MAAKACSSRSGVRPIRGVAALALTTALVSLRPLWALGGLVARPAVRPAAQPTRRGGPASAKPRAGAGRPTGRAAPTGVKKAAGPRARRRVAPKRPKVSDEPPTGWDAGPAKLNILEYPHPLLRSDNKIVEDFSSGLKQLSENLFEALYKEEDPPGIGLAAPQVGVNLRVMVYNPLRNATAENRHGQEVFVNPRITTFGSEQDEQYESCLSFPGMEGPVARPTSIEVEAVNLEGEPIKRKLEGLEARIFQHEYDHLDGTLYIDRMDKGDLKEVQKRLNQLIAEYQINGGKRPRV